MNQKEMFLKKYSTPAYLVAFAVSPCGAKTFARIMLAQSALETGWGLHTEGNNMLGVKDLTWLAGSEDFRTKEFKESNYISTVDAFEDFDDPTQSFLAYALLVRESERYRTAWLYRTKPEIYFVELQKAGYATDPRYAKKCLAVYKCIPDDWQKYVRGW